MAVRVPGHGCASANASRPGVVMRQNFSVNKVGDKSSDLKAPERIVPGRPWLYAARKNPSSEFNVETLKFPHIWLKFQPS